MFLREPPTQTLPDVREALEKTEVGEVLSALSSEIVPRLTEDDPVFVIKGREIPATDRGVLALGQRLHIPTNWFDDVDADIQQYLIVKLLERNPVVHSVKVSDNDGILDIWAQSANQVDPRRMVDIAAKVIDPDAPVIEWWNQPGQQFLLDVMTPFGADFGWGGDGTDLTAAALRFCQNRRTSEQFHAPEVSLLMWRQVCTNGYEDWDEEAKVDARGSTLEEVMGELNELAEVLFGRAEQRIKAFYEMRANIIANPSQRIMREAQERGIPDRVAAAMIKEIPSYLEEGDDFSEFHLVNMITNQANNPKMRRSGPRRRLQQAGGALIGEHVARCTHCQSKLS